MKKNRGILTVLSGFSGAGKGTLMKELLRLHEEYALSVSATTRAPRPGEQEGVDYFYKTEEEFRQMIENGELLEYATYVDHSYGTPRSYVEQKLSEGKDVILEIELQGALRIRTMYPDTLLLFVTPPSVEELERRLSGRGTESAEVIQSRLARAAEEAQEMDQYDYIVINDQIPECVETVHRLIQLQHARTEKQLSFITEIQQELKNREEKNV